MRKRLFLLLLALGLAGLPRAGQAYKFIRTASGKRIKWTTRSVAFKVNPTGAPAGAIKAVRQGMAAWSAAGSGFAFTDGSATAVWYNGRDGVNICCFDNLEENGMLAQNRLTFNPETGQLMDSDIRFNTAYSWSTNRRPGTVDVQNIATHELGHALALADLPDSADFRKTMYAYSIPGEVKKRSLNADDKAGILHLYP